MTHPGRVRTYDSDGNEIWTHVFDDLGWSDDVTAVAIDRSGHAVVFGRDGGELFLRAIDSNASVLWTRRFGTDEFDFFAEDIAISPSFGIVVGGGTKGALAAVNAGYEDAFVRLYRP